MKIFHHTFPLKRFFNNDRTKVIVDKLMQLQKVRCSALYGLAALVGGSSFPKISPFKK